MAIGTTTTMPSSSAGHHTRIVSSVPQLALATTSHDGVAAAVGTLLACFWAVDCVCCACRVVGGGGTADIELFGLVPSNGTQPTPRRLTSAYAWMSWEWTSISSPAAAFLGSSR